MKPRKNTFLFSSLALAVACTAQAAQIDVVGRVTSDPDPLAPENTTPNSGVRGVRALKSSPAVQTWTSDNEYFLTDRVFVPKGVTLIIEPGTKIYGSTNDRGTTTRGDDYVGSLIAARGGRIIAEGTPQAPILFTAVAVWEMQQQPPVDSIFDPDANIGLGDTVTGIAPTTANAGLWGGVLALGNAYLLHADATTGNNKGIALIEGFVPGGTPDDNGNGLPDAAEYGFDASGEFERDDNDDSGIFRYLSIEHGGYEFDTGREINGLTLGGVGAGTVIDHIEVVANQDDGIEFFGGTVSTSHIFLAYNQDDNFDFDSGYTGTMQFFCSVQNPGFTDGGFEHDGIENTAGTGYDNSFTTVDTVTGLHVPKPGNILSKPRMFNGTVIGPGRFNTFSTIAQGFGRVLTEKGNNGFIYDDYYNGEIYNSVIDDFSQDLAFFRDGAKSYGATADARHNTLGRFGAAVNPQVDTATAVGTLTGSGDIAVTVTGALVAGSPLAVNVPAVLGDTAAVWAGKVRAALAALPAITNDYTVTGSGSAIVIATKVNAANDTSLNIALDNGTTTGVTAAPTSANTIAGNGSSSVTIGSPLTYISGVNVRGLFMNAAGIPTGNNSAVNTDPKLTTYTRDANNFLTAFDPRPAADSPLLQSNGATLQGGAPTQVTYRGAFAPDKNWAAGWTQTWASLILQGGGNTVVDVDGDGIDDTLEGTTALTTLGFSPTVNNVMPTNLFESLYDETSILDLRTVGQTMVQKDGSNNVTLTVPVEKSTGLNTWAPAGTMQLGPFPGDPNKEFYRLKVEGAQ
jgi:hypothetical protein